MAPEIMKRENGRYDEKSDVYSCSIIFWEIFTRKMPYLNEKNQNRLAIMRNIANGLFNYIIL